MTSEREQDLGALTGSYPTGQAEFHRLGASRFDPERRAWAERIADQYCVEDESAIDAIEEGLARGASEARKWREERRGALDELIKAAAHSWGTGSEQHNLIRDVADALFREAAPALPIDPAIKPAAVEGELVERLRWYSRNWPEKALLADTLDEAAEAIASIREPDVGRLRETVGEIAALGKQDGKGHVAAMLNWAIEKARSAASETQG